MLDPKAFKIYLYAVAPFFFLVGLFHLSMGLGADALLGADVSEQTFADPGLDSQNRFYGVSLTLYGAIILLSVRDLPRYHLALKLVLLCMFLAGLARFVSVALYGWPPFLIGLLFAAEVILPPVTYIWMKFLKP